MESTPDIQVYESGDGAVRVVAGSQDRESNWNTMHSLAGWLETAGMDGIYGFVPTYDSMLVEFDPDITSARQVQAVVLLGMRQINYIGGSERTPREFDVPVVYGGDYGPDLISVAAYQGLDVQDVIDLHVAKTYVIRCLGAPAGSPMMDGPDFPLPVPRLKDPRLSVPAGAVSVAGRQAVIAPAVSPGGWCVIGQTPLRVLDVCNEPLVPYVPGDLVRFRAISEREFADYSGHDMEAMR